MYCFTEIFIRTSIVKFFPGQVDENYGKNYGKNIRFQLYSHLYSNQKLCDSNENERTTDTRSNTFYLIYFIILDIDDLWCYKVLFLYKKWVGINYSKFQRSTVGWDLKFKVEQKWIGIELDIHKFNTFQIQKVNLR